MKTIQVLARRGRVETESVANWLAKHHAVLPLLPDESVGIDRF
ncbi:MAG: hypothetical protein ACOYNF_05275 [Rhodoferax sp.]